MDHNTVYEKCKRNQLQLTQQSYEVQKGRFKVQNSAEQEKQTNTER